LHAKPHEPLAHVAVALATLVEHALPHALQLLVLVFVSTHDPLQVVFPLLHAKVHALLVHAATAFATVVEHAVAQLPQWLTLLAMSKHVPLHIVGEPEGQPERHEYVPPSPPPVAGPHTGVPPEQALPQLPQLGDFESSTHAPPQGMYPLLHVKPQAPFAQAGTALATVVEQAFAHVPQLFGSLIVSTHLPPHVVAALDGQLGAQAYDSPAARQVGVAPVHALPQLPQLATVEGSTQVPSQASIPLPQSPPGPTSPEPASLPGSLSSVGPSGGIAPASTMGVPPPHPSHSPGE